MRCTVSLWPPADGDQRCHFKEKVEKPLWPSRKPVFSHIYKWLPKKKNQYLFSCTPNLGFFHTQPFILAQHFYNRSSSIYYHVHLLSKCGKHIKQDSTGWVYAPERILCGFAPCSVKTQPAAFQSPAWPDSWRRGIDEILRWLQNHTRSQPLKTSDWMTSGIASHIMMVYLSSLWNMIWHQPQSGWSRDGAQTHLVEFRGKVVRKSKI